MSTPGSRLQQLVNGVLQFSIPESSGTFALINTYTLCKGGPDTATGKCIAEIDIGHAQLQLATATPHELTAHGPIPIRVKNLPVEVKVLSALPIDTVAVVSGNDASSGGCDESTMPFSDVTLDADISVEVERDTNHPSRLGYSKIRVVKLDIDQTELLAGLHFCPDNLGTTILGWFVPLLGSSLLGGFTDTLSATANSQLCQKSPHARTENR